MKNDENKQTGAVSSTPAVVRLLDGEEIDSNDIATKIVDWMIVQKYGDEEILHAAVSCDFVGRMRFIKAIEKIIDGTGVAT